MIKAIFFDAAGILYTRASHTQEFALNLLQNNGFTKEISSEQNKRLLTLRSQANQGEISHEVYWDRFLMLRGVLDPRQRKDYTVKITTYSNDVLPTQGSKETLSELKQRGFILGIITDTMYPVDWKVRRLKKAGVAEFIDIIACSTELGVHKPDPAIYSYAIQQANLNKGESAFVGHLGLELQGAHEAGMITIAINHELDANADYFCKSLLDLLTIPIFRKSIENLSNK